MTITNDDLLKEISQKDLTELSDLNATGKIDQDVIDDCMADALSFISSFFQPPKKPTALLSNIFVKLTIIELKKRNGWSGDNFKKEMDEILSFLDRMSKKKIPIEIDNKGDTPAPSGKHRAFRHNYKKPISLEGMQW